MHTLNARTPPVQAPHRCAAIALLASVGVAACAPEDPMAENPLHAAWVDPTGEFRVEVQAHAFPDTGEGMNHMSYGLAVGRDGFVYVGIGNNRDNAYLYRFDPQSGQFTELADFRSALPEAIYRRGNFGKFHTEPFQAADGSVWFASHPAEYKEAPRSGRLFEVDPDGVVHDRGPTPGDRGVYLMIGDTAREQLYVVTRPSHFCIYDLASGTWKDKGRFSSWAPLTGLFDSSGRLHVYGYDGEGEWTLGPPTITRYDPASDRLETSKNAPPHLWVGAVTPDGEVAYTVRYRTGDLYRWRFDEWPDFTAEELGRIDPDGREVYSNNLSETPDGRYLVVAGSVAPGRWLPGRHEHGIWIFEPKTGARRQVAELNAVLSRSLGLDSDRKLIYWTNVNTVDNDGWIWIGIHTQPSDENSIARLIGIRLSEPSPGR